MHCYFNFSRMRNFSSLYKNILWLKYFLGLFLMVLFYKINYFKVDRDEEKAQAKTCDIGWIRYFWLLSNYNKLLWSNFSSRLLLDSNRFLVNVKIKGPLLLFEQMIFVFDLSRFPSMNYLLAIFDLYNIVFIYSSYYELYSIGLNSMTFCNVLY